MSTPLESTPLESRSFESASTPHELTARLCIAASHPCLPGHFPGRPVVPGVVLLDAIADAVEHAGHGHLAGIAAVKFLAPLLPEQPADVRMIIDGQRLRFRIERDGTPILSGEGRLA